MKKSVRRSTASLRSLARLHGIFRRRRESGFPIFPGGLRNIFIHDYDEVNLNVVWDTAQDDLPKLIGQIEDYLAKQPPPE